MQPRARADRINVKLAELVLECAAFLELSGDDVIDPDSALTFMEYMAHTLQKLSAQQRTTLIRHAQKLAERQRDDEDGRRRRKFFASFATSFGIE